MGEGVNYSQIFTFRLGFWNLPHDDSATDVFSGNLKKTVDYCLLMA